VKTLEQTEPTFITKPAFSVVGLRITTKPKSPKISKLWDEFVPRIDELQGVSELDVSYGVMAGAENNLDYMAGVPVHEHSKLPIGMSRWNIPEATYAVFETTLLMIEKTFDYIFSAWLPVSDYQHTPMLVLERYGETFRPDNPVVSIYVPVKKKM
jgi:AraC family transcriptional regulator